MTTGSSRTISVVLSGLLSLSLASSASTSPTFIEDEVSPNFALYETTSVVSSAIKYAGIHETKTLRDEAFDLFGDQTNFSDTEKKTYWDVIQAKSEDTYINLFDLF